MNWQAISFDWNQVRAFLATVEEGSFSAAARALGLTQPTLSRQITALEENLGVTLFERGRRSMTLTGPGTELVEHVREMAAAAARISLTASGQSLTVAGKVTITATSMMATYFLPPILKKLRAIAPEIIVEIIASNEIQDLQKREADISIRHARPEQDDLIGKLVGETSAHFYASKDFLDTHGRPGNVEELVQMDLIGFVPTEPFIAFLNQMGLPVSLSDFKLFTGSGTVDLELIRQGLGVGVLTQDFAGRHPDIEQVLPQFPAIPVPIWLVTHRELHTSRRIRLVYDLLAQELADWPTV
jgi:DNA-binding transcriptional LysR family regulator